MSLRTRDFKSRASASFAIPARRPHERETGERSLPRLDALRDFFQRAGNGTRTRDPNLGKVVLYQLSYSRTSRASNWCEPRVAMVIDAHTDEGKISLAAPAQWRRGESNP